ncbi:MAG: hypothetical protein RIS64_2572 [Bacteroidota bacterium]|jgi:hypothetical protein
MESPPNLLESLFKQASTYSKTYYNLSKLRALETTTNVATTLVVRLCVLVTFALFLVVFNIGIALWLGVQYGKIYYGFLILAAFYFAISLFLHFLLHHWLKKKVSHFVINQIFQETDSCKE